MIPCLARGIALAELSGKDAKHSLGLGRQRGEVLGEDAFGLRIFLLVAKLRFVDGSRFVYQCGERLVELVVVQLVKKRGIAFSLRVDQGADITLPIVSF